MTSKAAPWMKFYPQDWRADEKLRMCSLAARGLWLEMLALMHRSDRYGSLIINGVAPSDEQLAFQVGAPTQHVSDMLAELERAGVFSRAAGGTIYSRRMKRDEKKAKNARENGKSGGNPKLIGSGGKQRQNPPSDKGSDNQQDNGGLKAQKPEARSQKEYITSKPKTIPPRAKEIPPPGITDAETALNYVCREADWWPTDNQRHASLGTIREWLALGCSLELILAGVALARARQPAAKTGNLKRFDSTIRGMRRDEAGELPPTQTDVQALTGGVTNRMRAN
jgi:hypothetical protein